MFFRSNKLNLAEQCLCEGSNFTLELDTTIPVGVMETMYMTPCIVSYMKTFEIYVSVQTINQLQENSDRGLLSTATLNPGTTLS